MNPLAIASTAAAEGPRARAAGHDRPAAPDAFMQALSQADAQVGAAEAVPPARDGKPAQAPDAPRAAEAPRPSRDEGTRAERTGRREEGEESSPAKDDEAAAAQPAPATLDSSTAAASPTAAAPDPALPVASSPDAAWLLAQSTLGQPGAVPVPVASTPAAGGAAGVGAIGEDAASAPSALAAAAALPTLPAATLAARQAAANPGAGAAATTAPVGEQAADALARAAQAAVAAVPVEAAAEPRAELPAAVAEGATGLRPPRLDARAPAGPASGAQTLMRLHTGVEGSLPPGLVPANPPGALRAATARAADASAQRVAAQSDAAQARQDLAAPAAEPAAAREATPLAVQAAGTETVALQVAAATVQRREPAAERAAAPVPSTVGLAGATGAAERSALVLPVTAPPPVLSTGAAEQVDRMTEQLSFWAAQKVQGAEIQLDAKGQAPISVSVQIQGHEAQVAFRSDQPELRQILSQSLPQLEKMLGAEGLMLAGAFVGSHAEDAARQQAGREGFGNGVPATVGARLGAAAVGAAGTDLPRAAPRLGAAGGRGLDLYV